MTIDDNGMEETSEDDEGVRITGKQPEMRKELDEEVDQIEFSWRWPKGTRIRSRGRASGWIF